MQQEPVQSGIYDIVCTYHHTRLQNISVVQDEFVRVDGEELDEEDRERIMSALRFKGIPAPPLVQREDGLWELDLRGLSCPALKEVSEGSLSTGPGSWFRQEQEKCMYASRMIPVDEIGPVDWGD